MWIEHKTACWDAVPACKGLTRTDAEIPKRFFTVTCPPNLATYTEHQQHSSLLSNTKQHIKANLSLVLIKDNILNALKMKYGRYLGAKLRNTILRIAAQSYTHLEFVGVWVMPLKLCCPYTGLFNSLLPTSALIQFWFRTLQFGKTLRAHSSPEHKLKQHTTCTSLRQEFLLQTLPSPSNPHTVLQVNQKVSI